jgi:hypothetical protein
MLDRIVGLASVVPFLIGSALSPPHAQARVDFTFKDPAIVESSALVVSDGLFVTTNDSGDGGRIFVVDQSGETVGTTTWDGEATDVESLAPAGTGQVWVGDTGDNRGDRASVSVLRVPFGRGDRHVDPPSYDLVYPGGPRDAETLLANPETGQLFVISKNIFGGTMYAAPRHLSTDQPNRLRAVADGLGFATDGCFFPDGRHYIVRNYTGATVYSFPDHEAVGSFRLPRQRQGEGIAVAEDGAVHVSTEGQYTDVLRVRLPRSIERAVNPPEPTPTPSPTPGSESDQTTPDPVDERPVWPWLFGGVIGVGAVVVLIRSLRPR